MHSPSALGKNASWFLSCTSYCRAQMLKIRPRTQEHFAFTFLNHAVGIRIVHKCHQRCFGWMDEYKLYSSISRCYILPYFNAFLCGTYQFFMFIISNVAKFSYPLFMLHYILYSIVFSFLFYLIGGARYSTCFNAARCTHNLYTLISFSTVTDACISAGHRCFQMHELLLLLLCACGMNARQK